MKVLVACEYSGIVRNAFLDRGHDAISCDLIPSELPGPHYQGDVRDILDHGWDIMIAHPPCTYLSNSGIHWLKRNGELNIDRYALGLEAKAFFLTLWNANIPKIAIENPVPITLYELPAYSQIIDPSQYGHTVKKRTCLWLKGLPLLLPTRLVYDAEPAQSSVWFNKGKRHRGKLRSATFKGIATAMASQWEGM